MTSWDGGTLDEREYLIVRGTVQQIVYYNDENGYAVLRLAAENGAEVTATGTFPNIGLGEEVILTGCWVTANSLRPRRLSAGCRPRCAASQSISVRA